MVLSDMGGMMGGRGMTVAACRSTVVPGDVSFRVWNTEMMVHEFVVLPLPPAGPGAGASAWMVGSARRGSLGEASRSCGQGTGDGIDPGAAGWVTLHLPPGGYELICNLPGHYAMGMFKELDVE